jgi:hypothetical protein
LLVAQTAPVVIGVAAAEFVGMGEKSPIRRRAALAPTAGSASRVRQHPRRDGVMTASASMTLLVAFFATVAAGSTARNASPN